MTIREIQGQEKHCLGLGYVKIPKVAKDVAYSTDLLEFSWEQSLCGEILKQASSLLPFLSFVCSPSSNRPTTADTASPSLTRQHPRTQIWTAHLSLTTPSPTASVTAHQCINTREQLAVW